MIPESFFCCLLCQGPSNCTSLKYRVRNKSISKIGSWNLQFLPYDLPCVRLQIIFFNCVKNIAWFSVISSNCKDSITNSNNCMTKPTSVHACSSSPLIGLPVKYLSVLNCMLIESLCPPCSHDGEILCW